MSLSTDQRWLLLTMGSWQIVDALIGPGGVNHLMQSHWGGYRGSAITGAPEWMHSFETTGSKIISPTRGEPRVTITAAQLKRFSAELPASIRAELEQHALERSQHNWRDHDWCHCGNEAECHRRNEGDPRYGNRHHPTDTEENEHHADWLRIRSYEFVVLAKALGLNGRTESDGPTGQLELFEVAV